MLRHCCCGGSRRTTPILSLTISAELSTSNLRCIVKGYQYRLIYCRYLIDSLWVECRVHMCQKLNHYFPTVLRKYLIWCLSAWGIEGLPTQFLIYSQIILVWTYKVLLCYCQLWTLSHWPSLFNSRPAHGEHIPSQPKYGRIRRCPNLRQWISRTMRRNLARKMRYPLPYTREEFRTHATRTSRWSTMPNSGSIRKFRYGRRTSARRLSCSRSCFLVGEFGWKACSNRTNGWYYAGVVSSTACYSEPSFY